MIYDIATGDWQSLALDSAAFVIPYVPAGLTKACEVGKEVKKGIAPAKRISKKTVLGSYPDYVKLSDELNARRFDIPMDVWNRMSPAERWTANQKFLDRMISRSDEIIPFNPASSAQRGTSFFREVEYLKSRGYHVSDDGMRMLLGE